MNTQMCTLQPANPLPLDRASAVDAYEMIMGNSLPSAVKELLDSVDSFVGRHLALQQDRTTTTCFCSYHLDLVNSSRDPKDLESMWILQRDMSVQLFKVMMGLVRSSANLSRRLRAAETSGFAEKEISPLDDLDLELAFTGDARGGYQWLNCLAKDECEWAWAAINGETGTLESQCPACLLGRAIDSESTIRLLITAARLLNWEFFVVSIQEHLACDPWWGPGYWETIEPKADILGTQIRDLLQQCSEIRQRLQNLQSAKKAHRVVSPATRMLQKPSLTFQHAKSQQQHPSSFLSVPIKLDHKQLHCLIDMLATSERQDELQASSGALRPYYNQARMANDSRLAAYCWFVLMYNISLSPSETPDAWLSGLRFNRAKTRSRTV